MSARTKEEELALDEKIARIQRKNEEILRRQKEIEEDKRMAEQQNAIVKLRPSTMNASRDRTPALKPSNRELRHEITADLPLQEPLPTQRGSRGSFRGRGGERFRGQGDWKTSGGPPPDPKSFLYDDERDGPTKDILISEQRREAERGRRDERDNRDNFRGGGREFQRGRRRDGMEYRGGERGRRGRGGRRNEEEEWRAERLKIDEARIQRQRAADGKWRREWDNDKVFQEPPEEPKQDARRFNSPQEKWGSPNQYHGQFHTSPDRSARHPSRGGISPRGGRGRGRLDPSELEMPLEKFQIEMLQSPSSSHGQKLSSLEDDSSRRHSGGDVGVTSPPSPHPPKDDFKLDLTRSVACVGNTVKVSIPNAGAAQSTPKPQRQAHEARGRFRSQTSYSSQSDDDSPRDRHQRGGRRQRIQKAPKNQDKNQYDLKNQTGDDTSALPVPNKPPLPPFRAEQKPSAESKDSVEIKDGDESWEDVTTSGTESMGEDLSSVHSSPSGKTVVNTMIISGKQSEEMTAIPIQSLEHLQDKSFDEGIKNSYEVYLEQLEMNEAENTMKGVASVGDAELQQQTSTSDTSSVNISLDTSDNFLLHEGILEESLDHDKSHTVIKSLEFHDSDGSPGDVKDEGRTSDGSPGDVNDEGRTSDGSPGDVMDEGRTSKSEDILKSTEQQETDSSKVESIAHSVLLTLYCKGVDQEADTLIQVEAGSNDHDPNCVLPDNGGMIQVSPEDEAVPANLQPASSDGSQSTDEMKVDEKESKPLEAEVVK